MAITRVGGSLARVGGALTGVSTGGGGLTYTPGAKTTLVPSDLTLLGRYRMPTTVTSPDNSSTNPNWCRFGFSYSALTGRYVDGQLRLFITMSQNNTGPLGELIVDKEPTFSANAPLLTFRRNYGFPYVRTSTNPSVIDVTRGLYWDESQQVLFYSWHPDYGLEYDRTVGAITFSGDVATHAAGPWRTSVHPKLCNAYMTKVPQAFADTYMSGKTVAIGSVSTSVNAPGPWGLNLHAFNPVTLMTTPANTHAGFDVGLPVTTLMSYTIGHKMARNNNWVDDVGEYNTNFVSTIDTFNGMNWIENNTKRGVLCFGGFIDIVPGYDYTVGGLIPGETKPHHYYSGATSCPHGQTGLPVHDATGPGTPTFRPQLWIVNPDDFIDVIGGGTLPYEITAETSHVNLNEQYGTFPTRLERFTGVGQTWYDETTRRLYVPINFSDTTRGTLEPLAYLYVFEVAD